MKGCNVLGVVVLSALLSVSASAACGGGGYNPQKSKTVVTQTSSVAAPSSVVSSSSTANFDASYFHSISGQLHMSGEQAAGVIKALSDIRGKLSENPPPPKEFDPKKEFEKRLATILNPEQYKAFQNATKSS